MKPRRIDFVDLCDLVGAFHAFTLCRDFGGVRIPVETLCRALPRDAAESLRMVCRGRRIAILPERLALFKGEVERHLLSGESVEDVMEAVPVSLKYVQELRLGLVRAGRLPPETGRASPCRRRPLGKD